MSIKMEEQLKLISKALHQGSAFQLPATSTIPDWALRGWKEKFMASLEPLEKEKIQKFRYMWKIEDSEFGTGPGQGVPSSMAEIRWLVNEGRLDAEELVEYQIVESEESLTTLIATELTNATPDPNKKAADRLVEYISGGVYKPESTAGAAYNKFVKDAEVNRKVMLKFHSKCHQHLHPETMDPFFDGVYVNWKMLISAVYRIYGKDESQETTIDFFKRIEEIRSSNQNTEGKIMKFRELIRPRLVREANKFVKPADFPGNKIKIQFPEEYNFIVNSLMTFILFDHAVPRTKWDAVQSAFSGKLQDDTSYMAWHKNRPELYKLMDEEGTNKKSKPDSIYQVGKQNYRTCKSDSDGDEDDSDDALEEAIAQVQKRFGVK